MLEKAREKLSASVGNAHIELNFADLSNLPALPTCNVIISTGPYNLSARLIENNY